MIKKANQTIAVGLMILMFGLVTFMGQAVADDDPEPIGNDPGVIPGGLNIDDNEKAFAALKDLLVKKNQPINPDRKAWVDGTPKLKELMEDLLREQGELVGGRVAAPERWEKVQEVVQVHALLPGEDPRELIANMLHLVNGADPNKDGTADVFDLSAISAEYGKTINSLDWHEVKIYDLNNDGVIGRLDLEVVAVAIDYQITYAYEAGKLVSVKIGNPKYDPRTRIQALVEMAGQVRRLLDDGRVIQKVGLVGAVGELRQAERKFLLDEEGKIQRVDLEEDD